MKSDLSEWSDGQLLDDILPADAVLSPQHRPTIEQVTSEFVRPRARLPGADGKLRLLSRIAQGLYRNRHYEAFLELLASVPAIEVSAPRTRLSKAYALERLGRSQDLKNALTADAIAVDIDSIPFFLRMRQRAGLKADPCFLERLFGPTQPDVRAMLRNLPLEAWRTPTTERVARRFYELGEARLVDEETYVRRFVWGVAARWFHYLMTANVSEGLAPLSETLHALTKDFDPSDLHKSVSKGRSVLIAHAHSGVSTAISATLSRVDLQLPNLLITNNSRTGTDALGNLHLGTRDLAARDLLKTIKILKKTPHRIRMFPDGPDGGDRKKFPLLGRTVSLGQGAAALAWHGRAATFFVGTRWRGNDAVEVYLLTGPVAHPNEDRDAFTDAFHTFYLDQLRAIVDGQPEDIGTTGAGIWPTLLRPSV